MARLGEQCLVIISLHQTWSTQATTMGTTKMQSDSGRDLGEDGHGCYDRFDVPDVRQIELEAYDG